MNFATWSIRTPIPSILLFIMLTGAGLFGFQQLPIQNMPDIELPTVNITLSLQGAAPAQIETEIARRVEDAVASVSGVKHIATSITDGVASIMVEFVLEKSLSDALIETKDAVDGVRGDLPTDLLPPTVTAQRIASEALVTYAISSDRMGEEALSWFVDDTVSKTLLAVKGVGKFERVGGVTREVRISIDPTRLAALGVTASDVSKALKAVQMESSGGRGQVGQQEQSLRTMATVRQAADLKALPIALANGTRVRLDQVATVEDTMAERAQAALLDGKPAIGFSIYRSKGADETRVEKAAQSALKGLAARHEGIRITQVHNSVDYAREQYEGSMHMLYEGALLAVLVVWFFLRDWRATVISALALPLSIIPTFAAMHWLGFTLNTLTLLAQAVVVGILVDDAIVEIENIVRHKRMGKSVLDATIDAVNEIAMAVIATTVTIMVVFIPTSMMSGVSGLFFQQFGWTIVISVFMSLLVARLLTPMMAATFLKMDAHAHEEKDSPLMLRYLAAVRWCLAHRRLAMAGAVFFFVSTLLLGSQLSSGFLPASDRGSTLVSIELPPGTPIAQTQAISEQARAAIQSIQGVTHIFNTIGAAQAAGGGGMTQAGEVRKATLTVNFAPRSERAPQKVLEGKIRDALQTIAGARFTLSSGGPGEKLEIILTSDQSTQLIATARQLERELRGLSYLHNVTSTASLERPEILIRPDAEKAAELGVSTQTIGDTVRIASAGDFDAQLAKLNLDNRQVYIRVQMPNAARHDLATLENLRVPTRNGSTSLASVASITRSTGPNQIDRYDRQRYVKVSADLGGAALGKAMEDARKLPAMQSMPSNVHQVNAGDAEIMAELFMGFGLAMITGIICVYCVLVLLFHDFIQPITILSALPLSLGGSIIIMLLTGVQLSLPALIGIVMLMGIVTKNSILLVEYAVIGMHERGLSRYEALLDACHKRARPIVMTTIAMIAGMLPIALGFGGDSSFRSPMAISVIGGLITSTALSLLIVPVVFSVMDDFEQRLKRLRPKP